MIGSMIAVLYHYVIVLRVKLPVIRRILEPQFQRQVPVVGTIKNKVSG
jgi:hypothetical protein